MRRSIGGRGRAGVDGALPLWYGVAEFDEPVREGFGLKEFELVPGSFVEEGDAIPQEDGCKGEADLVQLVGGEEALGGVGAADEPDVLVGLAQALGEVFHVALEAFDVLVGKRRISRGEHVRGFRPVGPVAELEDLFVRGGAHDEGIHAREERLVPVGILRRGLFVEGFQPPHAAVGVRDVPVQAGGDVQRDRSPAHGVGSLRWGLNVPTGYP